MRFTIFGSTGFIGSHLVDHLKRSGIDCLAAHRDFVIDEQNLGHVINCVGLTADFRNRPIDTVEAHVSFVARFLARARFDSFLYLSSTRVYRGARCTDESTAMQVAPIDPDDLYNLSKMTGESLCLSITNPAIRVVRLSNVYGADLQSNNFLASIIRSAVQTGTVNIRNGRAAQKDYISIGDVVRVIPEISIRGKSRLYNVASGYNVDNASLAKMLQTQTGCKVLFSGSADSAVFPQIRINKIIEEFQFRPTRLENDFASLVRCFQNAPK